MLQRGVNGYIHFARYSTASGCSALFDLVSKPFNGIL